MVHFIFSDKDKRYLFMKVDNEVDMENMKLLMEHINLVDPVCNLKTYSGPKFTQDFLFTYVQPSGDTIWYSSIGLWQEIYKFFKANNIEFDGLLERKDMFKREMKHSFEEFKEIVDSWGLKYPPRYYQYESAYKILQYKQSVSSLATRAGKTLIAYMIFRYCIEHLGAKRILMIVPSIQLVTQGYNDFKEYKEFFNTECIWGGGKLVESANLTIGTFQSLIKFIDKRSKKYNPSFFNGYDIVFVDETHRATSEQIKTIISQPFMKDVKISFGMTGTIPKENTIDYYCLKALLGATIQKIKPRFLMDNRFISDVDITQIRLSYKDLDKQIENYIKCAEYALSEFKTNDVMTKRGKMKRERIKLKDPMFQIQYEKELPFAIADIKQKTIGDDISKVDNIKKLEYIQSLKKCVTLSTSTNALSIEKMVSHFMTEKIEFLSYHILTKCDKNTLVLAHHTQYIRYITQYIKERFPDKIVETITGSTAPEERERIKETLKSNNNCILIASYGTLSTGITLANLCYGVLFESFKSEVVNMQSIGRGLGLSDLKDKFILYDIIDSFNPKLFTNKIFLQGLEKIKIYEKEKYPYRIINMSI